MLLVLVTISLLFLSYLTFKERLEKGVWNQQLLLLLLLSALALSFVIGL